MMTLVMACLAARDLVVSICDSIHGGEMVLGYTSNVPGSRGVSFLLLLMLGAIVVQAIYPTLTMAAEYRPNRIVAAKRGAKATVPSVTVTDLKHWSNPDYTRIAISVDHETEFKSGALRSTPKETAPSRIYVDIKGARIARGLKNNSVGDELLKTIRAGQQQPDVVRVVLDVENIKEYKVFSLFDPFRIVVDVKGERKTEISKRTEIITTSRGEQEGVSPILPAASGTAESGTPAGLQKGKVKGKRKASTTIRPSLIRRVVVDPGHGGRDPGAVGLARTMEKDLVLAIGLKLKKQLQDELGLDVVMTRSTDIFIPLEERTAFANKVNADLFISVHANAAPNRHASGIETYYLDLAKTEKARQLAARENNTSLEEVTMLQGMLFDLMANAKINSSALLANKVQKGTWERISDEYPSARNNVVKQGPFSVLIGANMPSILVETGFISNEAEEVKLNDPVYQQSMVEGIVAGVRNYVSSVNK